MQRLEDQLPVFGEEILEQRPLHRLFLGGARDKDRLEGIRVHPGVEHAGRDGAGGRVKVLHLLGVDVVFLEEEGELDRLLQGAPRVGGHEVRDEVLLLPELFGDAVEFVGKGAVGLDVGLAHRVEDGVCAVLGRYLELPGDVVGDQLLEKAVVRVGHQVVKPDARADEDLLDPGDGPDLAQHVQILAVIGLQGGTGGRGEALLPALAEPVLELLLAGRPPEVGGRAADIVDVPLEIRQRGEQPRFGKDRLLAAHRDFPPLVEGDGAEVAAPEAAAVVGDGEFHLLNPRHAAQRVVARVPSAHIGQGVDPVELLGREGAHRRVLDEHLLPVPLEDDFPGDLILLVHLDAGRLAVGGLIGADLGKIRALHPAERRFGRRAEVAGPPDVPQGGNLLPRRQAVYDLGGLQFPHPVA